MNHDTQPGQTVATPIEGFFKPLAYSLICLRQSGYPSIFYGDLYGMKGRGDEVASEPPACGGKLPQIILARKLYAYGAQDDYFDEPNCIGWVRKGDEQHKDGLACLLSNAGIAEKKMNVGPEHKGEVWTDVLGWEEKEVEIDDEGFGMFPVGGTSVSIFVRKDAPGREKFEKKL